MSVADGTYRVGDGDRWTLLLMGPPGALGRVEEVSVRFGSVTDRHRGQPGDRSAEDGAGGRSSRGRRVGIVAGAFVVPVVVASVIAFGLRAEPARGRPESAASA